jgi:hypothetical protein
LAKHVDRYRRAIVESDLPPSARWVAMCLSLYMDHDTLASAHPGLPRLSGATGYNERTVRRALKVLEEAGWVVRHSKGKRGLASTYQGTVSAPMSTKYGHSVPPPSHTTGRVRWSAPTLIRDAIDAVRGGEFWCEHAATLFSVETPRRLASTLTPKEIYHPNGNMFSIEDFAEYANQRMTEIVDTLNSHECVDA